MSVTHDSGLKIIVNGNAAFRSLEAFTLFSACLRTLSPLYTYYKDNQKILEILRIFHRHQVTDQEVIQSKQKNTHIFHSRFLKTQ